MADRGPLSHQQQRVWLLDRLDPGNPAYNVPFATWLRGRLDRSALAGALTDLAARHPALRTAIVEDGEEPVMVVSPAPDLPLAWSPADTPDAALDRAAEVARGRLDLAAGRLAVAEVISLPADRHLLVLVVHHIVCDGWAGATLLRDLGALYTARATGVPVDLPELTVTPVSHARAQREDGHTLHDSAERRSATASDLEAKGIDREVVATRMHADVSQAKPAAEAVKGGPAVKGAKARKARGRGPQVQRTGLDR